MEQPEQPTGAVVIPERARPAHPVVGIGASAGGLKALEQFFAAVPPDTGMAYIVVMHLSREHESNVAQILQRHASLPIHQIHGPEKLAPNCVYVGPPGKYVTLADGHVALEELPPHRLQEELPIDHLFRSLAEAHGIHAGCVVLSGTGADGTLGLKRVKELGGVTLVQDPQDAVHTGMPTSAIGTRMVDLVLAARDMPAQLVAYWATAERLQLPAEADALPATEDARSAVRDVLLAVRARSGADFTQYKPSTITRRIARRMQVNQITDTRRYLEHLRESAGEVQSLVRDLMISVTEFFRDPDAFAALESEVVPRLFAGKTAGDAVRVWVAGCATGEEAYSIAILLHEYAATLDAPPTLTIFATDIDDEALAVAREGVYSEAIRSGVREELLGRYFIAGAGQYRVTKPLRDTVVFAAHNLLKDSPFSRLDLVSCRNVLIYLNREAQHHVLESFHFALRLGGYLFTGPSDFADGAAELFVPVNKPWRIYTRRDVTRPPLAPAAPGHTMPCLLESEPPLVSRLDAPPPGELHLRLLELLAPPSVLVDARYDILHLSPHSGRFLRLAGGQPSHNLLEVVHPELSSDLRTALYAAAQRGAAEVRTGQAILDGQPQTVRLVVRPALEVHAPPGHLLVLFETGPAAATLKDEGHTDAPAALRQLEDELQQVRAQMRAAHEQHESAAQSLYTANEELQSTNEELRAATEELETSKEEIQAANEELTTVNQELKNNVDELDRTNSDLRNLMAATDIATVFLDRSLRIKRFTPRAQSLFSLLPTDVGRPLSDLTHKLHYEHLGTDAVQVLARLITIEKQVASSDGRHFIARLLPYRTTEDRIDGVVLTFVDVTDRTRAEHEAQLAREQMQDEERRRTHLRQLVTVQEAERSHLARELHDQMGQELAALSLRLAAVEHVPGLPETARQHVRAMQEQVGRLGRDVQRVAYDLRPVALDDLGLKRALESYVELWPGQAGIDVEFHCTGLDDVRLAAEVETVLYRIVQEALTNVSKHAETSRASVILERRDDHVQAIVEDYGKGFDTERLATSPDRRPQLGLIGMKERAALVGGTVQIESTPGRGTTVFATIPFAPGEKPGISSSPPSETAP